MNISKKLLEWFKLNQRMLPWREQREPYNVWLSEIILQQTRVDQGLPYYLKFTVAYPTVFDLARANEEEVLKLWQGLGYYSRARNLHQTAKMIVNDFGGEFPDSYNGLLKLKGIGPYTAAAISSISFGEAKAVVDGNVYRVLARVFNKDAYIDSPEGKREFAQLAQTLVVEEDAGAYNQAIMEFGALQCIPKNPDCKKCTLKQICLGFASERVEELPRKERRVKQKPVYFNYIIIIYKGRVVMQQRTEEDIWKMMYQFPLIQTEQEVPIHELTENPVWKELVRDEDILLRHFKMAPHLLSHRKIISNFYVIQKIKQPNLIDSDYFLYTREEISNLPVPKLIDSVLPGIFESLS